MSADNTWSGRVTITPPLTWAECKLSPGVEDVKLDIHEEDGPDGRILTAVAVVPARTSDSWSAHTGQELQFLIDSHPGHEFDGYLQVDWDPGIGGDPAHRYMVRGRRVEKVTPRLVWPGEDDSRAQSLELTFSDIGPLVVDGVRTLEFTDFDPESGGCRRRSGDATRLVVNRRDLGTIRLIDGSE